MSEPCQSQDRSIWSTTKDARIKPNVKIKLVLRRPRFDSCDLFLSAAPPNGRRGVERNISGEIIYIYSSTNFPLLAPVCSMHGDSGAGGANE